MKLTVLIYLSVIALLGASLYSFTYSSFLYLFLGYSTWLFTEYGFHRFFFHNKRLPRRVKKFLSNGHVYHHRYPDNQDRLFLPVSLTFPISILYLCICGLIFGLYSMFWFYIGLISGYFIYEFMHYAAHHYNFHGLMFKYMKIYHIAHHTKAPQRNFMVSNPAVDFIFRSKN
jgi:dihydroceramide fatty acyl 2-hydroxylase